MQGEDKRFDRYVSVVGLCFMAITATTALVKMSTDKPSGSAMLVTFLTGLAGGTFIILLWFLYRAWAWKTNLNQHWPLNRTVVFWAEGQTEDNVEMRVVIHGINWAPAFVTITEISECVVTLGGTRIAPGRVSIETDHQTLSAIGTPERVFLLSFPHALTADTTGNIELTVNLARPYTQSGPVPFQIPFNIHMAQPG